MTETKTFAQKRLTKLIESYKESRRHKLSNQNTSLKSYQQSGNANEKNKSCSNLKSFNKNKLSSSNTGMVCQQIDSSKDVAFSPQSLKSCEPQTLSDKSNIFVQGMKHTMHNKCLQVDKDPPSISRKEADLKRPQLKKLSINRQIEKGQKTSLQTAVKRRSDHDNVEKKKITKNKKIEDSSKNLINKKSKNDPIKVDDDNGLVTKLSLIVDSYSSFDDNAPSQRETKNKTENDNQIEELDNNRKNIKSSPVCKKDSDPRIKEKEKEIKNREKMKLTFSSPKTKLQKRLQKIKADIRDKQKGTMKNIPNDKFDIPKDDNPRFIESMDWEPSNDLILRSNRDEVDPSKEIMEWQDICYADYNVAQEICANSLYLVVDTNVLIRNIELIKRLSKTVIRGFKIIQVIPWQVLKELDNLKTKVDYENVNFSARKVIRFLSEATNSEQFNIMFQSQSKHFKECAAQFVVEVPDDHLIKCCFQLKEKGHKVLLLSNDVNLRVKSNSNNIQAVDSKFMATILDQESKPTKQSLHFFENKTKQCQRCCDNDNYYQFAHKTTEVILSFLYNIVVMKYKEKYEDLWPLWIPKEPHFPELTNFMTSSSYFQPYWIKLNLIKDFFIKKRSHDDTKPADIEKLGRNSISLVKSMCNDNFILHDVALQFFKELSFLKCFPTLDWSNCNYIEGSYRLAQKYFKDTEDSLNEFVAYIKALFAEKGPLLYRNEEVLHHIEINLKLINQFRNAILQFQLIPEQISEDNEVAKVLHKAICDFLGEKIGFSSFPIFSPEDIVEFVNPNRNIFTPALSWLMNQESTLTEIRSKLV